MTLVHNGSKPTLLECPFCKVLIPLEAQAYAHITNDHQEEFARVIEAVSRIYDGLVEAGDNFWEAFGPLSKALQELAEMETEEDGLA